MITDTAAGSGRFRCPRCDADTEYVLLVTARRSRVLWLPIGRAREVGRSVRCGRCGGRFEPDVLFSDDERFARGVERALREGLRGLIVRMVVEDGRVAMEERAIVERVHSELLDEPLDPADLERDLAAIRAHPRTARDFARQIAPYLDSAARQVVLRAALRVAAADGELHVAERRLLAEIAAALDLSAAEIEKVMAAAAV